MLIEYGRVRKPGWANWKPEAGTSKRGSRNTERGTMAAGPGVSMQSGSPATELSLSVQQGANQTHGDRVKTEEVTGKNPVLMHFFA